jgi:hypothetical protein
MSTVGFRSCCCISSVIQCICDSRGGTGCSSGSTHLSSRNAGTEAAPCSYIRSVRANSNTNCQVKFDNPEIMIKTKTLRCEFPSSMIIGRETDIAMVRPVTFWILDDFIATFYRNDFSAEVPGLSHDKLEELRLLRRTQKRKSITVDGGLEGMDSAFIQVRISGLKYLKVNCLTISISIVS